MRNRQCLYKQDTTSDTKSCTCIYSVVIPIHMASVYLSFSYSSLTTNLKYTVYSVVIPIHMNREMASVYLSFSYSSLTTNLKYTVPLPN